MKVLYYYNKADKMIARHMEMLNQGLGNSADLCTTTNIYEFKKLLETTGPDLVHLHGCWHYETNKAAEMCYKRGIRYVLSPHGHMNPWGREGVNSFFDLAYRMQRHTIERAYALIGFGKMEEHYLQLLNMNSRIEIIRNAVITNSITPQQMCTQTLAVYQKVLDSNTLELMGPDDRRLLAVILKAGITGDARWITSHPSPLNSQLPPLTSQLSPLTTRRLLIYAEHENIRNYVDYGISILGLHPDDVDTTKTAAYFPEKYQRPTPLKELIGDFKGDEADYLVRMFRQIQKAPRLLHLVELHRELMRDTVSDDRLGEALEEKRLTAFARRIIQILSEQTLLDEGFMPLEPLDDRGTQQIRLLIANHLKI